MSACTLSPSSQVTRVGRPAACHISISTHARQRLAERFPQLARLLGTRHAMIHWLTRQCDCATVIYRYNDASELRSITIAHVDGPIELVLATRQDASDPTLDVLATVLTRHREYPATRPAENLTVAVV